MTYVIAEVGSNWQTLNDCLISIKVAKDCAADAVKFQLFSEREMFGTGFSYPDYGTSVKLPYLPPHWLHSLKAEADIVGIDLMCTAFSVEGLRYVDQFVVAHKIASSDNTWPQLLQAAAATGKETLLSTGAASPNEIGAAKRFFKPEQVKLLYCVSAYPAANVDLDGIPALYDGFSDHTTGFGMAIEAHKRGAKYIEKHFTAFPKMQTPDRKHSLPPDRFKAMTAAIKGTQEQDMYLRHNRRLVATAEVAIGEELRYGKTFGAYRSRGPDLRGLSPLRWQEVEGKTARVAMTAGQPIGEGDFS